MSTPQSKGRKIGRDFVYLVNGLLMSQLLPDTEANQLAMRRLIDGALHASQAKEVNDVDACAKLQDFCKILLALFDLGKLIPEAPLHMRDVFLEGLEIAGDATDLNGGAA
jgi:hypothetical protein